MSQQFENLNICKHFMILASKFPIRSIKKPYYILFILTCFDFVEKSFVNAKELQLYLSL